MMNIEKICNIAKQAGHLIMDIYERLDGTNNKSLVEKAGKESHQIIKQGLQELYPDIPVISDEEKDHPYDEISQGNPFWLIDPLDGLKEFIKNIGEFTVNIALIKDTASVLGVIYIPVEKTIYYAQKDTGAWKMEQDRLPERIYTRNSDQDNGLVLLKSRSHPSQELKRFVSIFFVSKTIPMGSSKKFCVIAEGKADIYPRLGPTGEWDTAAGHCIVEQAGGIVVDINHEPLAYRKKNFLNDNFIIYSSLELMLFKPKSEHIPWHHATIQRTNRENLNKHSSCILWFTGLSGSGKSTLAHAVEDTLHRLGCQTFVLDGDNVRHGLNKDLGFSVPDRQENLRRIGEVCSLFIEAGVIVLACFISPFKKERDNIRKSVTKDDFIEIFCDCSIETCEKRDVKGHYKKARAGEIQDFTGVSSPYEIPETPELALNTGDANLYECVDEIVTFLKEKNYI